MSADHFDVAIFIAGLLRVCIWWAGAILAFYRKRRLLALGFGLAGTNAIVFAITNAHGTLPGTLTDVSSFLATPIAGLIVLSFVLHQPKGAGRPGRWSP